MGRSIHSGTTNSLQENKGGMDKIKDYYEYECKLYSYWKSQFTYLGSVVMVDRVALQDVKKAQISKANGILYNCTHCGGIKI